MPLKSRAMIGTGFDAKTDMPGLDSHLEAYITSLSKKSNDFMWYSEQLESCAYHRFALPPNPHSIS